MPIIEIDISILAPVAICFDAARNIDLHVRSMSRTKEKVVAGVSGGLIEAGQEVTWEARHFFVRQRLAVRITVFDPPRHFRDSQIAGPFRRMDHDHFFFPMENGAATRMVDRFDYESPLGWLGRLADILFLERYMRRLLETRNRTVQEAAIRAREN
jgi:ligand-binding SRPBCC domain-containing protein